MINLDLNLIKTFVVVYESKSISIASHKLFVSQPAISGSIKKLENFLSVRLFIRKRTGVVPTMEGTEFYNQCKTALNTLRQGVNNLISFNNLSKGHLRIGSSSTIIRVLLTDFITEFSKEYPKIKITIVDGTSGVLLKALRAKEIDLAILSTPISNLSEFLATTITTTTDSFIAAYNFEKDFIDKSQLKNFPLVVQKFPSNNRESFEKVCQLNNLNLTPNYEMTSFGLITDFVEKGLGIGFTIEDFIQKDLKSKRVKIIKTNLTIPKRKVVAIVGKDGTGIVCKKFIEKLQGKFQK